MNGPYKRVMLKLSGEVFGGGKLGVDPDVVAGLAKQIAIVNQMQVQVAVVVGGGTPWLPDGLRLRMRLLDEQRFAGGMVHLRYAVGPSAS